MVKLYYRPNNFLSSGFSSPKMYCIKDLRSSKWLLSVALIPNKVADTKILSHIKVLHLVTPIVILNTYMLQLKSQDNTSMLSSTLLYHIIYWD